MVASGRGVPPSPISTKNTRKRPRHSAGPLQLIDVRAAAAQRHTHARCLRVRERPSRHLPANPLQPLTARENDTQPVQRLRRIPAIHGQSVSKSVSKSIQTRLARSRPLRLPREWAVSTKGRQTCQSYLRHDRFVGPGFVALPLFTTNGYHS